MRIGSLFSGAGGLDMAVEAVFGGEVIWQSELDKAASTVLAHRFPGVPDLGDITAIGWADVEPVDVLCGGYPCQPFSQAGKRKGTDDERHLWPYFADAIRALRPRYAILENVAGHRSMGFDSVLADLAALRYDAQWVCVRASDVGAPHRRERLFVIASDTGYGTGNGQWACQKPWQGSAEPLDLLPTPRTSDTNGAGRHGDGGMDLRTTVTLFRTPNASDAQGQNGRPSRASHQSSVGDQVVMLCTPSASDGAGGKTSRSGGRIDELLLGGQEREMASAWGKYEPAIRRWESIVGPAPAPTEPNKNGNPRLSAAFSQWLMGWPPGWVTDPDIGISRNDQLRIIGNGVCPQQAIAALRFLLSVSEVAA